MDDVIVPIKKYVLNAIVVRAHSAPELVPSEYWIDFASNFRYVYDLSEKELNRIRFHTYHLTSDIYLTYYFANESLKKLLENGYRYFATRQQFTSIDEGKDGIGVATEFGRISHDLLRYLGAASDLIDAGLLARHSPQAVIEIGGGYGGLARVHLTHNPRTSYFICDLEETIFFSAVYLSKHLGAGKVHLVTTTLANKDVEPGHVYIVAQSKLEYLDDLQFDYAISQQSLQEMTLKQVTRYLEWLAKHAIYLYSCNIADHAALAQTKRLILNLPMLLDAHFSTPCWRNVAPCAQYLFGDNHLSRAVYKCLRTL
jgi:hypothetical protein